MNNFKNVKGEFCMLYDYIITNYKKDEPIFLAELPGKSRESVRQEMKKLTDEGKIERLYHKMLWFWSKKQAKNEAKNGRF